MCMFCRSLFLLLSVFFWPLFLSVLRFTDSDYPYGIVKLFLKMMNVILETCRAHYFKYLRFHHYPWGDTSASALLVPLRYHPPSSQCCGTDMDLLDIFIFEASST